MILSLLLIAHCSLFSLFSLKLNDIMDRSQLYFVAVYDKGREGVKICQHVKVKVKVMISF